MYEYARLTHSSRNILVNNNLSNYAIKWPCSFSNVILIICKFYGIRYLIYDCWLQLLLDLMWYTWYYWSLLDSSRTILNLGEHSLGRWLVSFQVKKTLITNHTYQSCLGSWTRPITYLLVHNNLSNYAIIWPYSFSNVIMIICKFYGGVHHVRSRNKEILVELLYKLN